ncbi:MAG: class I SAM-dependent methyltransferase [Cytophagaceae bacterium]
MTQKTDPKELAANLRKPEGEYGRKVAEMLNNTNRYITGFTYATINPEDGQHILEIGFGNGRLMPELLNKASNIKLTGIDFSMDMVEEGQEILKEHIDRGDIELLHASVESLPFGNDTFDAICTINTLYFWPDPLENAKEILRVLKPGHRVFIGIRPKKEAEKIPATKFGFTLYEQQDAIDLLEKAGFENVTIKEQSDPPIEFNGEKHVLKSWVIIGDKPGKE